MAEARDRALTRNIFHLTNVTIPVEMAEARDRALTHTCT